MAVDLDGTLITPEGGGAAEARQAFAPLIAAGIEICIATGRMAESAAQLLAEMGVHRAHIIALNGAEVWNFPMRARPLRRRTIPARVARQVRALCSGAGAEVQGYVQGELRLTELTERARRYAERTRLSPRLVDPSGITDRPQKLLALIDPDRRDALLQELLARFSGAVSAYGSEPDFIEIVPPGVDKGEALRWLCGRLGIGLGQVYAAGDAQNDLAMLRIAGFPFAPVSATEEVRGIARLLLPAPPRLAAALAREVLR